MLDTYDHDVPVVDPAKPPDFSEHFSVVTSITKDKKT